MKLSTTLQISRRRLGVVYKNIVVEINVKLICLVLVALNFINMWLAILG